MKLTRMDWASMELLATLISLAILGIAYVSTR
jgi:hypothetical protein